ncbi:uncharacterized protein BDV14DRAFT_149358 [Aspergillus stella-maris]|uniref:uncharacterized protein n=1 Tax=Aspergillus stella-maris TaxID=1810926 RepID=UPI003CCDF70C
MPQFIPLPPNPSIPGSTPPDNAFPDPIPIAPPPWTLRAKSWTFLYTDPDPDTSVSNPPQNPNNTPEILQVLPPGSYHPFETIHASALTSLPNNKSQFEKNAWLKCVMIVRYEKTDVGPYDELIFMPGRAINPNTNEKDMRISTIYVSTDASVWNGRRNWNIPKHRAIFDFKSIPGTKDIALRVFHPENSPAPLDPKRPFFTALLKGSALPKIPLPGLAPLPITQPPLLPSRWPAGIQDATIGTDDPEHGRETPWLKIKPSFKGRWGLAYPDVLEEKEGGGTLKYHGDGVGFPEVKFRSVGTYFEGVLGFGIADVVN